MATVQSTFVCQCASCPRPIMKDANSLSTGYGSDRLALRYCFECCADHDRAYMRKHGKISLYLVGTGAADNPYRITNWPNSQEFQICRPVHKSKSRGFGWRDIPREDFWFRFDGAIWHGVCKGDMQFARCRRTKERV